MTTATAHPNIALVKYWGKQQRPGNYPATANLSITLSDLVTTTTVSDHPSDEFWLNGEHTQDPKVAQFLSSLRESHGVGPLKVDSHNNFPTGAGLASSASGFAALITAINAHAELNLDAAACSNWARQGSASAARSLFAGFVSLAPPGWQAECIAGAEHWPLDTIVAITSERQKTVSSTEGMNRSRLTSVYYSRWVETSQDDFTHGLNAIHNKDFEKLAEVAELSCLKMHSVMLTSVPTLMYWNPTTMACMDVVRSLRAAGTPVFFTIDAGPQLKAICEPGYSQRVAQALAEVSGVKRTLHCGMGGGACVVPSEPQRKPQTGPQAE